MLNIPHLTMLHPSQHERCFAGLGSTCVVVTAVTFSILNPSPMNPAWYRYWLSTIVALAANCASTMGAGFALDLPRKKSGPRCHYRRSQAPTRSYYLFAHRRAPEHMLNASRWALKQMKSLTAMSEPKSVVFMGPEVAMAGKTLVHHLKTGHYVDQQGGIHPEVEEDVIIGAVSVKAFIAPGNEGSRRLFQETITEDLSACHGIVYLMSHESVVSYKRELAALLQRVSPVPVLVLALSAGDSPAVEELSKELKLQDYPNGRIKLSVSSLPLAAKSEGFEWLAQLLSEL